MNWFTKPQAQPIPAPTTPVPPVHANVFAVSITQQRCQITFGYQFIKGGPSTYFSAIEVTLDNAQWIIDLIQDQLSKVSA